VIFFNSENYYFDMHLFNTLLLFLVYNIYDECGSDERRRRLADKSSTFTDVRKALSAKQVTVETENSFTVNAGYGQVLKPKLLLF